VGKYLYFIMMRNHYIEGISEKFVIKKIKLINFKNFHKIMELIKLTIIIVE